MQKKLIVLVVAAAASGVALAQTNVQIYGSIDVGFSHRGDNVNDGVGSKNAIDSGISSGNRLGFRGTEDLGNGIKALFVLESGFQGDTGTLGQSPAAIGSRLFGRQAYLGLTGNFGTVIAGRLYAPHYSLVSSIDPFRSGTVGQYRNVFASGLQAPGENLFDPTRVDNAVAYVSPSWGGFNVTAAYSTNAIGTESVENNHDNTVIALLPRYTNGPLDVGFSYHRIKDDDDGAGILGAIKPKITNWAVAGTYDFKVVRLHAFYDKNKLSVSNPGWDDITLKSWLLGVTVPFGKHAIQASYTQSKLDDQTDDSAGKAKQWALGYTYALSRRTNFYAAVSDISNDNEDGRKANKVRRTASVGDASNGGEGYQNGFNIGLKHTF
ncbi:MAG: porin [Zoogloeaceae bacterium]|nr:porin [Zoogloeaceae bacterium]